jgi:8-oxo-dGTP pyrophosphatase MutT (NUDIX family)
MDAKEFEKIEILSRTPPAKGSNFLGVHNYHLRNLYTGSRQSAEYSFDLVVTRFSDAVVVVPYYRSRDGSVFVGLRYGLRPAVFLRDLHVNSGQQDRHSPIALELVAGGVETGDYDGIGVRGRAVIEVVEESGFSIQPSELVELGTAVFSTPGFAIEKLHYFCVEVDPNTRRKATGEAHPLEEVQEIAFVELPKALSWCRTGRISDNKTEVALFRFASWIKMIPSYGLQPDER